MQAQAVISPTLELVHTDARGEIYRVVIGDRELMLHRSVAGALRGGHSHDYDEQVLLLTGKMRYWKLRYGQERTFVLEAGMGSLNPAGEVHLGEFLEDSWLIEWKIGPRIGEGKTTNYEPYRSRVKTSI